MPIANYASRAHSLGIRPHAPAARPVLEIQPSAPLLEQGHATDLTPSLGDDREYDLDPGALVEDTLLDELFFAPNKAQVRVMAAACHC